MSKFVVRIRDVNGCKKLRFDSDQATWGELQFQIKQLFRVPASRQQLSVTPLSKPTFLKAPLTSTFASLKIRHGDMLFLVNTRNSSNGEENQGNGDTPQHKLTAHCRHPRHGRCPHCLPRDLDEAPAGSPQPSTSQPSTTTTTSTTTSSALTSTGPSLCRCSGPRQRCAHCAADKAKAEAKARGEDTASASKPRAGARCRHGPGAKCPRCLGPKDRDSSTSSDPNRTRYLCKCDPNRPEQKCLHCYRRGVALDRHVAPYLGFLQKRRRLCGYNHDENTTCPACAPIPFPSYKGDETCKSGHLPFPKGTCVKCQPKNAVLRLQKYRYCDHVEVRNQQAFIYFHHHWKTTHSFQQQCAAVMLGFYEPEDPKYNNPGGVRAVVEAFYEPPQRPQSHSVEFLRDLNEPALLAVCGALGLKPVGWVVTVHPEQWKGAQVDSHDHSKKGKYRGNILMTAWQARMAAAFQNKFRDRELCAADDLSTQQTESNRLRAGRSGGGSSPERKRASGKAGRRQGGGGRNSSSGSSAVSGERRSRFVTMLCQYTYETQQEDSDSKSDSSGEEKHLKPVCYQVSDQAVALEREGFLRLSETDRNLLRAPAASDAGTPVPTLVYENRPLRENQNYLVDFFLVKVSSSQQQPGRTVNSSGKSVQRLFDSNEFPPSGNVGHLRNFIKTRRFLPTHLKLSDFHALMFLAQDKYLGVARTVKLCRAVRSKQPVSAQLDSDIAQVMKSLKIAYD